MAEDPIVLAVEDEEASTSWATIIPALVIIGAVLIFGLVAPDCFADTASATFTWLIDNLGWAFVLFSTVFVIFVICIAASGFGSIRLGAQDEQPEFSSASWISMMFAAGMGIGSMFYGASEPLSHYLNGVPNHESREVGTAMATVFGTACSLGLGVLQIRAGLQVAGLVEDPGTGLVITIVLVLTLAFLISTMSGVGRANGTPRMSAIWGAGPAK